MLLYRHELKSDPMLLVPDDISIPTKIQTILKVEGVTLVKESDIELWLASAIASSAVLSRNARTNIIRCRCCDQERISYKQRTFCVDCQAKIHNYYYDSLTNHWVLKPENSQLCETLQGIYSQS